MITHYFLSPFYLDIISVKIFSCTLLMKDWITLLYVTCLLVGISLGNITICMFSLTNALANDLHKKNLDQISRNGPSFNGKFNNEIVQKMWGWNFQYVDLYWYLQSVCCILIFEKYWSEIKLELKRNFPGRFLFLAWYSVLSLKKYMPALLSRTEIDRIMLCSCNKFS